ncbi:MAG: DegT/DnrJ/EryC1/StrS family aminotransferase [Fibrobacteria bacterium]|nr:DegT/DnrJ/EryC1/StrS family aminotransferase [Fibrobacteria bacterium]
MITMNDFKRDDEQLVASELAATERVLRSGWWVLGPEVRAFESEWASWSGARFAVGVANGMDALEIGLRAIGVGPGDEVVTTPMTAFATILAILRCGAAPVLADIDADTGIIDPVSVERCLTPRTRAVAVVHLYGQAGPVEALSELCRSRGIHLVEDCAQAHGAEASGRPCGTWGSFAGWSFYPTKNLGCLGDGGALSTESEEIDARARVLRNYGQSIRYHHPEVGLNSRLDELQAAILRERLKRLDAWTARRRQVARAYADGIRHPSVRVLPLPSDPRRHVHHLFVVTTPVRDALQGHLKERGVESLFHYPIPVHRQDPCTDIGRDPAGLAVAEKHAAECLSLPIHPGLTDAEIDTVVSAVNSFRG